MLSVTTVVTVEREGEGRRKRQCRCCASAYMLEQGHSLRAAACIREGPVMAAAVAILYIRNLSHHLERTQPTLNAHVLL